MDIALPDGRTAYAYTGGKPFDADLPTVAFIHGALNDHSVWTLLARWFAHHGHGVLAVDLPGHGRSHGPALESVEAMADWLLGVLDAVGASRASLVGHSMGSLIALEAAARAPQRARHLVMIATAVPMTVSPMLLEMAANDPPAAIASVNAWSHSTHAAKPSHPGPGSWLHGGNAALMHRMQAKDPSSNLFLTDFRACNAYAGGLAAAERIECPATIVIGARDQMTPPRSARAVAEALRVAPQTIDAGHALMTEGSEALLGVLRHAILR
ncbi:alpha/beta fold hydrolase [Piscinibacter koreensis]|uniref:Alpha/beta hydrolase n=1 Tax=Piscinibacter koreensis TaxID=2742824 RepID=A0A7Y6TY54_9BURK|nr:alpha/beta hydrolase [Schlegelella koreensis]NUZ07775.1 alpha/beta hydrolase [Schlegelella koreensis]